MNDYSVYRGDREYLPPSVCLTLESGEGTLKKRNFLIREVYAEDLYNICYLAEEEEGDGSRKKRLVRQFYPDPVQCEIIGTLDGSRLKIRGYAQSSKAGSFRKAFMDDLSRQEEYRKERFPFMIPLEGHYLREETGYMVYDLEGLTSPDLQAGRPWNRKDYHILLQLAEKMAGLQEKGWGPGMIDRKSLFTDKRGKLFILDRHSLERKKTPRSAEERIFRGDYPCLPPELDSLKGNYEQADYFLSDRTDVFCFGCLLYEAMTGEEADGRLSHKDEPGPAVRQFVEEKGAGFGPGEREGLVHVLSQTFCPLDRRYKNAGLLYRELKKIIA